MSEPASEGGGPVSVGIIGAGNVLWAYLQLLDRLVPRGLATEGPICARDRGAWPGLLTRRPGACLVATPEEVVEAAEVVVVITPPDSHVALARLALEAGRSVVVEKPLAERRGDAEDLVALAAERAAHLLVAPFVQLAPTFRMLWTLVADGAIGTPHSARGLYGNAGSTWARWYHGGVGPLAEAGIYNLKSLTALLGPVVEVQAAEHTARAERTVAGEVMASGHDVCHAVLRHEGGALSSVAASQAISRYRRPGLELYGTEGTANLLGDDWDPAGIEVWRDAEGRWEEHEALDPTWLWTDGLRAAVVAVREGRPPLTSLDHDLHLLEVLEAARTAARSGSAVAVRSGFAPLDLRIDTGGGERSHLHDHTRPPDEQ